MLNSYLIVGKVAGVATNSHQGRKPPRQSVNSRKCLHLIYILTFACYICGRIIHADDLATAACRENFTASTTGHLNLYVNALLISKLCLHYTSVFPLS